MLFTGCFHNMIPQGVFIKHREGFCIDGCSEVKNNK